MAILVKPVQRINPLDKEAPKKWYVTQVTTAQADETEVAMELADYVEPFRGDDGHPPAS